jgi:RimJ/RimL family protein N-acetyltransferase
MNDSLFEGELVRLAAPDPEHDAEIESQWTHDPEFLRLIQLEPARPLSPGQIKKRYEKAAKEKNEFHFTIRTRADDRLVGLVSLLRVEWNNGVSNLAISIGRPDDRGHGYGTDALQLILRYAFGELNLYRLSAMTFEYNTGAVRFLERNGFSLEVRRRQALNRDGRRWDALIYGLLREEWSQRQEREA